MSSSKIFSSMTRPHSLILDDKALLPEPLLAVALYDFEGESEMAELTFKKGQLLKVFCEDFGASWSLAMLVDAQGLELVEEDGSTLSRGLIAQGFYEYISQSTTRPSSQERHQVLDEHQTDARDEDPVDTPLLPSNIILVQEEHLLLDDLALNEASQALHTTDDHVLQRDGNSPDQLERPEESAAAATIPADSDLPDISADYLDDTTIESSTVIVTQDSEEDAEDAECEPVEAQLDAPSFEAVIIPAPPQLQAEGENAITEMTSRPPSSPPQVVSSQDLSASSQLAPPVISLPKPAIRTRQTSINSIFKTSNPIEAYLSSDLPYEPDESVNIKEIAEIEDGKWVAKIPPFQVSVPSYSQKKVAGGRGEYTVFQIVSTISAGSPPPSPTEHPQTEDEVDKEAAVSGNGNDRPISNVREIAVDRRYTHFQHLHTILKTSLPLIVIPDLPEKRLTGNFSPEFLDRRRRDLERYLLKLARHDLIRSHRSFLDFLGNENEENYDANLPRSLMNALRMEPELFFTRVKFDAADYFDEQQMLEEVQEEQEKMSRHVRAVEKGQGTPALQDSLTAYREKIQGTGTALSDISLALISLISGLAQPKGTVTTDEDTPQVESTDRTRRRRERAKAHNMQNDQGAFCWRDTCQKCLSTTKAVQEAAEAISLVGDLYDANARKVLLAPQEQLVEWSLPRQRYQNLLANVKIAQRRLSELLTSEREEHENEEIDHRHRSEEKKRCEVVLNSLLAEMEYIHTERREDLQKMSLTLLNGQIAFHERALARLHAARDAFDPGHMEELAAQGPRLPSILEKAVLEPGLPKPTLSKPSTFGLPAAATSTALRPISSLVSSLFTSATGLSGTWRSAFSAIKAQSSPSTSDINKDELKERLGSPSLASSSRFAQFLDWTMNSRGEQRKFA